MFELFLSSGYPYPSETKCIAFRLQKYISEPEVYTSYFRLLSQGISDFNLTWVQTTRLTEERERKERKSHWVCRNWRVARFARLLDAHSDKSLRVQSKLRGKLYSRGYDEKGNNWELWIHIGIRGSNFLWILPRKAQLPFGFFTCGEADRSSGDKFSFFFLSFFLNHLSKRRPNQSKQGGETT